MADPGALRRGDKEPADGRVSRLVLPLALLGGFILRLGTWPQVFLGGASWLDGPDAYYHLRRAWLTLQNWPVSPQTDMMVGVPEGGPISWPPVFDLLLATVALPFGPSSPEEFERLAAWMPPLLGVLEIGVLYAVARRLLGRAAAGWAALVAAFLPGVARYSLLGALDHDPLIEVLALVVLYGLIGAMRRTTVRSIDVAWTAVGLSLLLLTWAGSVLHLGLFACLALALEWKVLFRGGEGSRPDSPLGATLGAASLVAALVTLPFVLTSVWTLRFEATFIGLSWLHTAMLLGLATLGWSIATRARPTPRRATLLGLSALGVLLLVGTAWSAFAAGLTFFGRGEPFLRGVMESQPLLWLFGPFDLRAPIVRLSPLLLLAPFLAPWTLRRRRGDRRLVFLWTWLLFTLGLALVQSRYAHAAALPIAALAGFLIATAGELASRRRGRFVAVGTLVLVAASSLPAYMAVPGLESFRFFGRVPKIVSTRFFEACDFLRETTGPAESWSDHQVPSSRSVLAPWSAGHWLIWRGRQAVVTTPLGPQGQPAFVDGVRFYLESDIDALRELITGRRIRHFVALAQIPPLEAYASLAGAAPDAFFTSGDDGTRFLDGEKYLRSIAARLTWLGPAEIELFGRRLPALEDFREVYRSEQLRPNPFAAAAPGEIPELVPVIRVFEVREPRSTGTGQKAASDRPSVPSSRQLGDDRNPSGGQ